MAALHSILRANFPSLSYIIMNLRSSRRESRLVENWCVKGKAYWSSKFDVTIRLQSSSFKVENSESLLSRTGGPTSIPGCEQYRIILRPWLRKDIEYNRRTDINDSLERALVDHDNRCVKLLRDATLLPFILFEPVLHSVRALVAFVALTFSLDHLHICSGEEAF